MSLSSSEKLDLSRGLPKGSLKRVPISRSGIFFVVYCLTTLQTNTPRSLLTSVRTRTRPR